MKGTRILSGEPTFVRRVFVKVATSMLLLMALADRPAMAGSASGILYETFGTNGVAAIDLANPSVGLGNLFITATNIVASGGEVYLESGSTIYSTSPTLHGLTTVITNNAAPAGLAILTPSSVPEPSTTVLLLSGLLGVAGWQRHAQGNHQRRPSSNLPQAR